MTEMPPEQPQQIPPAFQPNGHTPSQIALALLQQMPQMLFQAVAQALSQVPVRTISPLRCAQCQLNRLTWMSLHSRETDAANAAYGQALAELAGLPEDDPRRGVQLDAIMFLPEALRPGGPQGIPGIAEGAVMLGGGVWCLEHIPGAPGKTRLLVASAAMSPFAT